MELIYLLLAIQTVVALTGGLYLWRRQERQSAEIIRLREALAHAQTLKAARAPARRAAAAAEVIPIATGTDGAAVLEAPLPLERARRAWNLDLAAAPTVALPTPGVSADTARGLTLGLLALAPAIGLAFGASVALVVACGLAIGAAMMTVAHRAIWRAAAWAGVATAGGWALIGFAVSSAHTDPVSYSVCVSLAAATGLIHGHMHRATPGATMALIMLAAMLALGSQIGMVSAAGVAFGVIVVAAAVIGAMSLRLEGVHVAAFAASLIGLFVLSGQDSAAIWFTPAAAWTGALFFAIAAVRVPQAGARGVAIAGTGALAPLATIAALHLAHQGLANNYAAAGAFAVAAALIAGVIAVATLRRDRGVDALKVTLWVLAFGAFAAFAAATALALPAPAAAPVFAMAALCLAALDLGLPSRAWRAFACLCAGFSVLFAFVSGQSLLAETSSWPGFLQVASGLAAPAVIVGAAASAAKRRHARLSAGFLDLVVIAVSVAAANLAVRLIYSGGALILVPISFAEVGAHIGVWLAAAFIIRWRARFGAHQVRILAANLLLAGALGIILAAAALWTTPYWTVRHAAVPTVSRDTLGFLVPAILFFANWWLLRGRHAEPQTRLCLAAGAFLLAAFVAIEAVRADGNANWIGAVVGALAFAMAVAANFAPGVLRTQR